MLTTIASYRLLTQDVERSLSNTRSSPAVQRESDYYLANIEKVKSIDDFLGDNRLFNYAMEAFGLEEMSYAKAFMRKALEGGIDERNSFANGLADVRYREFVETFNFARYGETATIFERARSGTVDRFVRQTFEIEAGNQNQGVRLALYFQRKAPTISSAFGILADRALLEVAEVALGLPGNMSNLDIDRQAKIISDRLDIDDLKDPRKLEKLIEGFTARWDVSNPSSTTSIAVPNAILSSPTIAGVGIDILASLQNLKIGG
ncbi:MAG: DUF1217 domain-containing protein [Alphaproteobacteria bacterium]|nr:DUF1217 domain-containing protein [Alphaproteobacteria bacterium]